MAYQPQTLYTYEPYPNVGFSTNTVALEAALDTMCTLTKKKKVVETTSKE